MNLKELKSNIVYFTMLISMILTFLGLINSSYSNVNTGVTLFILVILSLLNNVFIYQIFKKCEKKEYIKKLLLFYAIVFVVSALDLLLIETRNGASIGSGFWRIIYFDFLFILILFLENILTISHINAYKTNGGSAKKFVINLLMYTLKHYLLSIIPVFIFYFIYKTIVESDGMHYVYFSDYIVILLGFSILSVIATVNYLLTCFNEFVLIKRNIKITNVGILLAIFLALPIYLFNVDLFEPIYHVKEGVSRVMLAIDDKKHEIEEERRLKEQSDSIKENMRNYIRNLINDYNISSIETANVGDIVKFGKSFMKNNISKKEENYYYVFDKNDDEMTLISLYLIDVATYDDIQKVNGVEKYKTYLDTEFYKNAFNDDEKKQIKEKIYDDGNSHKVYIPSAEDVFKYDDDNFKKAISTSVPCVNLYDTYMAKGLGYEIDSKPMSYMLSPHILKTNTFRKIVWLSSKKEVNMRIRDYDIVSPDNKEFTELEEKYNLFHMFERLYIRPKITVKIQSD